MATRIYWFSGTGNSFAVAKALRDGLDDAELVPIVQGFAGGKPVERIGLVFPVYGFGPPAIVTRFMAEMPLRPDTYVFAVVTHGGMPGGAVALVDSALRKRGAALSAAFDVRMVENYPPFGGAPSKQKQQRLLSRTEPAIAAIAEQLRKWPRGTGVPRNPFWRLIGPCIHWAFLRGLARADRKFRADDKCNSCGVCVKICPVRDIELVGGVPQWLGHCEQCYACFHWCPEKAIQYGRRTAGQERYHHPAATLADMRRAGASPETPA